MNKLLIRLVVLLLVPCLLVDPAIATGILQAIVSSTPYICPPSTLKDQAPFEEQAITERLVAAYTSAQNRFPAAWMRRLGGAFVKLGRYRKAQRQVLKNLKEGNTQLPKQETFKDYEAMSQAAKAEINDAVHQKNDAVLLMPTGRTPLRVYELLVEDILKGNLDLSKVTIFMLDEYVGGTDYHDYIYDHLINKLPEGKCPRVHVLNGLTADVKAECANYERLIRQAGGIDLALIGTGPEGHIGFNESGSPFDSLTREVKLSLSTIMANGGLMHKDYTHALTVGIRSILSSKKIILIANGKFKAGPIAKLLHGTPTEQTPVTALLYHPDATVLIDEGAAVLRPSDLLTADEMVDRLHSISQIKQIEHITYPVRVKEADTWDQESMDVSGADFEIHLQKIREQWKTLGSEKIFRIAGLVEPEKITAGKPKLSGLHIVIIPPPASATATLKQMQAANQTARESTETRLHQMDTAILEANRLTAMSGPVTIDNGGPHDVEVVAGFTHDGTAPTLHYLRIGSLIVLNKSLTVPPSVPQDMKDTLLPVEPEQLEWNLSVIPIIAAMQEMDLRDQVIEDDGTGRGLLSLIALKRGARRVVGIDVNNDALNNTYRVLTEAGFHGRILDQKNWRWGFGSQRVSDQDQFALIPTDLSVWFKTKEWIRRRISGGRPSIRIANIGPHFADAYLAVVQQLVEDPHHITSILGGFFEDDDLLASDLFLLAFPKLQREKWHITRSRYNNLAAFILSPKEPFIPVSVSNHPWNWGGPGYPTYDGSGMAKMEGTSDTTPSPKNKVVQTKFPFALEGEKQDTVAVSAQKAEPDADAIAKAMSEELERLDRTLWIGYIKPKPKGRDAARWAREKKQWLQKMQGWLGRIQTTLNIPLPKNRIPSSQWISDLNAKIKTLRSEIETTPDSEKKSRGHKKILKLLDQKVAVQLFLANRLLQAEQIPLALPFLVGATSTLIEKRSELIEPNRRTKSKRLKPVGKSETGKVVMPDRRYRKHQVGAVSTWRLEDTLGYYENQLSVIRSKSHILENYPQDWNEVSEAREKIQDWQTRIDSIHTPEQMAELEQEVSALVHWLGRGRSGGKVGATINLEPVQKALQDTLTTGLTPASKKRIVHSLEATERDALGRLIEIDKKKVGVRKQAVRLLNVFRHEVAWAKNVYDIVSALPSTLDEQQPWLIQVHDLFKNPPFGTELTMPSAIATTLKLIEKQKAMTPELPRLETALRLAEDVQNRLDKTADEMRTVATSLQEKEPALTGTLRNGAHQLLGEGSAPRRKTSTLGLLNYALNKVRGSEKLNKKQIATLQKRLSAARETLEQVDIEALKQVMGGVYTKETIPDSAKDVINDLRGRLKEARKQKPSLRSEIRQNLQATRDDLLRALGGSNEVSAPNDAQDTGPSKTDPHEALSYLLWAGARPLTVGTVLTLLAIVLHGTYWPGLILATGGAFVTLAWESGWVHATWRTLNSHANPSVTRWRIRSAA